MARPKRTSGRTEQRSAGAPELSRRLVRRVVRRAAELVALEDARLGGSVRRDLDNRWQEPAEQMVRTALVVEPAAQDEALV